MSRLTIIDLTEEERNRIKAACAARGEYVKDVGRRLLLAYADEWEQEQQDAAARVRDLEDGT